MKPTIKCVACKVTNSTVVIDIDDRYGLYGPHYMRYQVPCELVDRYSKAAMLWSEVQAELSIFLTATEPLKQ